MSKELKGVVLNELSNLFIWSGFKYYLRKPEDSYILYSPTKYWRNQNLVNKKFNDGFLCNRHRFHADDQSAIGCIWWENEDDLTTESLRLAPYDVEGDDIKKVEGVEITLRKSYHKLSEEYDKREFEDDEPGGILCEGNGLEFVDNGRKKRSKPVWNKNIIAYLKADGFSIDRKHVSLTVGGYFTGHGFYVRSDNFIEKLPLFAASVFPCDKWYKSNVYSKSYDGRGAHLNDKTFLKRCLIYTALSSKNKCRSISGSDGRFYRNELCFHGEDTLAWNKLQEFQSAGEKTDDKERDLLKYWNDVLYETKKTEEYKELMRNSDCRLGLWQIKEEVNVKEETGQYDKKGKPILRNKYTILNTQITSLETELKRYYETEIAPLLFKYELIK